MGSKAKNSATIIVDGQHATAIMWQPSCDGHHVTAIMWQPSCDSHHVTAIMWQPSCDPHHVTAIMWRPSCDRHHVTAIMWQPSCDSHHVTAIMRWPSCDHHGTSMWWQACDSYLVTAMATCHTTCFVAIVRCLETLILELNSWHWWSSTVIPNCWNQAKGNQLVCPSKRTLIWPGLLRFEVWKANNNKIIKKRSRLLNQWFMSITFHIKSHEDSPINTGTRPNTATQCHGDLLNIIEY